MTDEEMAKEYADEYGFGSDCNNLASYEANHEIEQAYLAGLEAGKLKWHDLRKNPKDVPLIEGRYLCILDYKRVHNMPVVLMYSDDCLGHFVWVADDDDIYDGCISRWAEIPKYTEKE